VKTLIDISMRRHLYFQAYNLPNIAHLGCSPRCWHVGNDVLVISRTFHWYIPAGHMIMYTDKQNSGFQIQWLYGFLTPVFCCHGELR